MSTRPRDGLRANGHIPGEPGLWVLIGGDLCAFSAFFVVYMVDFAKSRAVFHAGQQTLDTGLGLLNTLLLLTSSWFVARAVAAARENRGSAKALVSAGMGCGGAFVVAKAFEWHDKIAAGLTLNSSPFHIYYFMFTGIHLIHVFLGLGVLAFVRSRFDDKGKLVASPALIEGGAAFWHLVDLLWLVIFALLYLT